MPVRPCLARCGALIPTGSYCTTCRPRNGSTTADRKTRTLVLERDNHACQHCGAPATHADHITPASHGGTDHPNNRQALCPPCNMAKGNTPDPIARAANAMRAKNGGAGQYSNRVAGHSPSRPRAPVS